MTLNNAEAGREYIVRAIQTADTKRRHTMLAMRINELTKE